MRTDHHIHLIRRGDLSQRQSSSTTHLNDYVALWTRNASEGSNKCLFMFRGVVDLFASIPGPVVQHVLIQQYEEFIGVSGSRQQNRFRFAFLS